MTRKLTGDELKSPELSQPATTALQLALLSVLSDAGVSPTAVVGHSSGEIAAATAAGYLSPHQAIKIAYLRGRATAEVRPLAPLGMLAVGLGVESTKRYLAGTGAEIACINSPESVTVSGFKSELVAIEADITADGKFARLLQVESAYHSRHMTEVGNLYKDFLTRHVEWQEKALLPNNVTMVSSTTGNRVDMELGPEYWVQNMVSPVLFNQAASQLLGAGEVVDNLIEIGPSGALGGPISQIKKLHKSAAGYHASWKRGEESLQALLGLAGQLFIAGHSINITKMNQDSEAQAPSFVVDLPNYSWNHSVKYWAENEASADWRFREFVHHDLLGTKVLGTSWQSPTWKKIVNVLEEPWLADHIIGESVIFPASGYIAMAVEALFQRTKALGRISPDCGISEQTYQLRDVRFDRALSLDNKDHDVKILLSLVERESTKWHEFRISSIGPDRESDQEHCRGLVSIMAFGPEVAGDQKLAPLQHSTPASTWYKAMREVGYCFGPSFQKQLEVEAVAGQRKNRALVSLDYPPSSHRQSTYPLHPACLDSCFQAGSASLHRGHRTGVSQLLLPAVVDELTIPAQASAPVKGMAVANAEYIGKGRKTDAKRYKSNVDVFDVDNGRLIFRLKGLHYHALDHAPEMLLRHTFTRLVWNPDFMFLSTEQLRKELAASPGTSISTGHPEGICAVGRLIDLVAHKQGYVRLLEKAHDDSPSSLWLESIKTLASYSSETGCEYHLSLATQNGGLEARARYGATGGVKFVVRDDEKADDDDSVGAFDVAIIQVSSPKCSCERRSTNARSTGTDFVHHPRCTSFAGG